MTRAEVFSWCCLLSIGGPAWLAAGVPGALCLLAGVIVSQIDVGWADEQQGCPDAAVRSAADRDRLASELVRDADSDLPRRDVESAADQRLPRWAVTSISIFIFASARPAENMVAAGRTSLRYLRIAGQQAGKSPAFGRM